MMGSKVYRYGGNGRSRQGAGQPAKKVGWGWFVLPVLVALPVLWLLWPKGAEPQPEEPALKAPKTVKEVKPSKGLKGQQGLGGTKEAPKTASPKAVKTEPEMYLGRRVVSRTEKTNANGRVTAFLTTDDGLTHRTWVHVPGNDRIILKRGTDHVLASVLCVPEGTDAPPVPLDEGMEAEFLESLKEPIEDKADDTPEERRMKEVVRQAREDVKTLMDQGMSFRQIIMEHQAKAKENSEIRLKIMQEAARIRESHGEEEEQKYRKAMNEALERMGIAPVGDGRPRTRSGAKEGLKEGE